MLRYQITIDRIDTLTDAEKLDPSRRVYSGGYQNGSMPFDPQTEKMTKILFTELSSEQWDEMRKLFLSKAK